MQDLIKSFQNKYLEKLATIRPNSINEIKVGNTVSVKYKITEGATTRIQAFNGIVVARAKSFLNYSATFTVRKISNGVGVERKFLVNSPLLASVEILKKGVVRRAKLYYLRKLTGKASRIKEKLDFLQDKQDATS